MSTRPTPVVENTDPEPDAGERNQVVAKAIQALLERHAVPERQRLITLQSATGLSYQAVRRRNSGFTPWAVEEIQRLASHFGEPLFKLLGTLVDDAGQPATVHITGTSLSCSIWPGPVTSPGARIGPLVAIPNESRDHWTVVPLAEAGERPAHEIRRLIYEAAPARRVAVVIQDDDLSLSIVQFLREKGLDAISYPVVDHALAALQTSRHDGFIVDWTLSDEGIHALLPAIRSKSPRAPVIVLAGHLDEGQVEEDALAATIATYRAQLYEKPTRALSLFNALCLGFDTATRA